MCRHKLLTGVNKNFPLLTAADAPNVHTEHGSGNRKERRKKEKINNRAFCFGRFLPEIWAFFGEAGGIVHWFQWHGG